MEINEKKNIAILGSTGSIGTQTLDIIADFPDKFHAALLTARGNWQLLAQQAKKFLPEKVVIAEEGSFPLLKEALSGLPIDVACGPEEIAESVKADNIDMVVTAMVGYSGLLPTINAIKAGKTIALANKETLVVAGELITALVKEYKTIILPVDSEHSAIFQCLQGENRNSIRKIILTASGGPFRKYSKEQLKKVTVADALNHPNWNMGSKVTIDSASMMNKGFEMIEAKWLFGCSPDNIVITVHPQSIIHSAVEFFDGSVKAQLGIPDMHLPISYALGYPERIPFKSPELDLFKIGALTFEEPDIEKFPLLGYAFEAIKKGGNMPCILNAANEVAVAAFLKGKIGFTDMPEIARYCMDNITFIEGPDLDALVATNSETIDLATSRLNHM